ncbi:hypothetical protein HYZ41_00880 [archaeon]|nr:hypothetical protein [archaeon]
MNYISKFARDISNTYRSIFNKHAEKSDFNYKDFTEEKIDGYIYCNENSEFIREKTESLKPRKIGGICSGGDILILSLLPSGADIIAMDISYDAIAATILKLSMLKNYKSDKIKEMISSDSLRYIDAFKEFMNEIPKNLEKNVNKERILEDSRDSTNAQRFEYQWSRTSNYVLDSAREKIDNLTLIHENLKNIKNHGTFDFIYASNAIDFGRVDDSEKKDIIEAIEDSGHILTARTDLSNLSNCKLIESVEKTNPMRWDYYLYQKNGKTD